MSKIILHGRKVVGGCAEGEALVSKTTISGWGGIDPQKGVIVERRHPLRGQSFKGKVLVIPGAKGSSGGSGAFHGARLAGAGPKAFLFNEMTSKMALVSVVAQVPAMTGFDKDPLDLIQSGDWVKVDADNGIVEVTRKTN
jgi:predicted aconitase with swiveling domain